MEHSTKPGKSGTNVDDKFDSEVCSIRCVDKARTAFRLFLQRFFLKKGLKQILNI